MKKILVGLAMLVALSAHADGWHRHYGRGGNFLLPMIIGGVIGYEVNKHNEDRRDEQQYRREEPAQRGGLIDGVVYVEVLQYDQNCNCYRKILVPRQ